MCRPHETTPKVQKKGEKTLELKKPKNSGKRALTTGDTDKKVFCQSGKPDDSKITKREIEGDGNKA